MDQNPACKIMTVDCPPENECELNIDAVRVTPAENGEPACSTYDYHCTLCGSEWTVHWPQVQPRFDRDGNIISAPDPIVISN